MNKKLLNISGKIYTITEDLTLDETKEVLKDAYSAKRYWNNRINKE